MFPQVIIRLIIRFIIFIFLNYYYLFFLFYQYSENTDVNSYNIKLIIYNIF